MPITEKELKTPAGEINGYRVRFDFSFKTSERFRQNVTLKDVREAVNLFKFSVEKSAERARGNCTARPSLVDSFLEPKKRRIDFI